MLEVQLVDNASSIIPSGKSKFSRKTWKQDCMVFEIRQLNWNCGTASTYFLIFSSVLRLLYITITDALSVYIPSFVCSFSVFTKYWKMKVINIHIYYIRHLVTLKEKNVTFSIIHCTVDEVIIISIFIFWTLILYLMLLNDKITGYTFICYVTNI